MRACAAAREGGEGGRSMSGVAGQLCFKEGVSEGLKEVQGRESWDSVMSGISRRIWSAPAIGED